MKTVPNNNEKTFLANVLLVTKTDLQGKITYANRDFMKIVGLDENFLIGAPHNIIRHPDMPKIIFKLLWAHLKDGKEIHAYVKNICKDGSYYWVFANVTPSYDNTNSTNNHKIVGYHSSRRLPSKEALAIIIPFYETLLKAEKKAGMQASEQIINDLLKEKGISYDEFILSI